MWHCSVVVTSGRNTMGVILTMEESGQWGPRAAPPSLIPSIIPHLWLVTSALQQAAADQSCTVAAQGWKSSFQLLYNLLRRCVVRMNVCCQWTGHSYNQGPWDEVSLMLIVTKPGLVSGCEWGPVSWPGDQCSTEIVRRSGNLLTVFRRPGLPFRLQL